MIGSGFLPWWRSGGDSVSGVLVPAQEGIGLEGPGIVIFGAAILALVLLDIGYMRGRWGFILDAPAVYLVLGLIAGGRAGRTGAGSCGRSATCRCRSSRRGLALAAVGRGAGAVRRGTGLRRPAPVLSVRRGRMSGESRIQATTTTTSSAAEDEHRPQVRAVVAAATGAAGADRRPSAAQISPR